jgi:CO/xanthine dehydrogenase FAD-binding subunit
MKPAPFEYIAPTSLEEAIEALVAANGDGKVMAGGQSLIPLLNFRMARPSLVVGLQNIPGLSFIDDRGSTVVIGALTRHADVERSSIVASKLPVMSAAMPHVAHLAIRNRGTIGGSIAHADPAAEHPMLAVFYDATIRVQGPKGRRDIPAERLFCGALMTSLDPDEIVREIEYPILSSHNGWGFEEVARRFGDFALGCVAVSLERRGGLIRDARVAIMGVDETPRRLRDAEAVLCDAPGDTAVFRKFSESVRTAVSPPSDIHVSSDYRRALIGSLAERGVAAAWSRAAGGTQ